MYCGCSRYRIIPRNHIFSDRIRIISSIPGQCHWNHKIVIIVPNEIKNYHIFLVLGFSKSSAKLLYKYNRRLRRAKHDHLVHFYDIYTLIQNIY